MNLDEDDDAKFTKFIKNREDMEEEGCNKIHDDYPTNAFCKPYKILLMKIIKVLNILNQLKVNFCISTWSLV
ncbi:unnamed protein product [Cunninghamella echinulata]